MPWSGFDTCRSRTSALPAWTITASFAEASRRSSSAPARRPSRSSRSSNRWPPRQQRAGDPGDAGGLCGPRRRPASSQRPDTKRSARAIVLEQKELPQSKSVLPIVTAGTADMPVAMEAKVTAEIMGQRTELICDVGVAGLHRLFGACPSCRQANVIVVVAGMEGALASVLGGLVSGPVIAVPTSVGYGTSFQGLAALLTMLNSCASGITVVNIDNGFSAAVTATMINRKIDGTG